jgi:hypothetical protein
MCKGDLMNGQMARGVSNELRKHGIFVSASGVRSVWLRRDLESFKKRLPAVKVA